MRKLIFKSPSRVRITLPVRNLADVFDLWRNGFSLLVLPLQPEEQNNNHNNIGKQISEGYTVTNDEARAVTRSVELCANHSTAVANADLHSVGDSTLGLTRNIDGGPRQHESNGRIDPTGSKEHASIRDPWSSLGIRVTE